MPISTVTVAATVVETFADSERQRLGEDHAAGAHSVV